MLPRNSFILLFGVVLLAVTAMIEAQSERDWGGRPPFPWRRLPSPPTGTTPTRQLPPRPPKINTPPIKIPRTSAPRTRKPRAAVPLKRHPCRRNPLRCSSAGPALCVNSRNRKHCRRVANKCVLRNLNCQSKPRKRWSVTNAKHCSKLKVGAPAKRCKN